MPKIMSIYDDMLIYEEFIKKIGYSIVEKLQPASCAVYLIKNKGYKVIKISNKEDTYEFKEARWEFDHILREHEILKEVKGVDGIAQMLDFYRQPYKERDEIVAIIKKYINGKTLSKKISSAKNQKILEQAVRTIHKIGFADLDLWKSNIIIEEISEKPYIIDLGYAKSKKEVSAATFKKHKEEDLRDLENILDFKRQS